MVQLNHLLNQLLIKHTRHPQDSGGGIEFPGHPDKILNTESFPKPPAHQQPHLERLQIQHPKDQHSKHQLSKHQHSKRQQSASKLQRKLFLGGLSLSVSACGWAPNAPSISAPVPSQMQQLNQNIRNIRTGDLIIRVVDRQNRGIAQAEVKLEQTRHYFQFGTALATEPFSPNFPTQTQYLNLAKQLFNAGVHENALKWRELEKVPGQINYQESDRIFEWTAQQGWPMRGHTLFWEVEQWVPEWLKQLSPPELEAKSQNHASEVCRRYRGKVIDHDVNNEMLHGDFFRKRLGDSVVGKMFRWCKTADPTAKLYVNDYNILNEQELNPYINQIRTYLSQGVGIDGIGVQAHIRQPTDAAQVTRVLDALGQFRLPIKLTEFGAVGKNDQDQARILQEVYTAAFAHPLVEGIYMWGFWEGANWEPKAAIYRQNFEPKPAAKMYQDLVFKQWWTKAQGKTDGKGEFNARPFFGEHALTVVVQGKTLRQNLRFTPQEATPKVITVSP